MCEEDEERCEPGSPFPPVMVVISVCPESGPSATASNVKMLFVKRPVRAMRTAMKAHTAFLEMVRAVFLQAKAPVNQCQRSVLPVVRACVDAMAVTPSILVSLQAQVFRPATSAAAATPIRWGSLPAAR